MVRNCPEWEFSGGQLSGLAIVRVVNCPGGGNRPGGESSGGVIVRGVIGPGGGGGGFVQGGVVREPVNHNNFLRDVFLLVL